MKIMQCMAGAEFGGAEAFFMRLSIAMHRAGIAQRVIIREHAVRAQQFEDAGVDFVQLPFGGRMDFSTKRGIKRQIDQFKPDVVLTWMNRATSMCPQGEFVHAARLGGYYDLKYYQRCDHLIGNTRDIVEYLIEHGWDQDKAHYLPNFVASAAADPIDRASLFTPKGVPLILAMGRLHENKAFDVLIKAVSRVPDAYLWIAGEGPLKSELQELAEKVGIKPRVRFLGWREDTAAILQTADVFVCPSRHEPLGNVVIEAWAQGKPVVAADSMGPGTLIKDMESGLLVPVDDDVTLARAIRAVLSDKDLAERISDVGWREYQDHFTEEKVVALYRDFFERIIG